MQIIEQSQTNHKQATFGASYKRVAKLLRKNPDAIEGLMNSEIRRGNYVEAYRTIKNINKFSDNLVVKSINTRLKKMEAGISTPYLVAAVEHMQLMSAVEVLREKSATLMGKFWKKQTTHVSTRLEKLAKGWKEIETLRRIKLYGNGHKKIDRPIRHFHCDAHKKN